MAFQKDEKSNSQKFKQGSPQERSNAGKDFPNTRSPQSKSDAGRKGGQSKGR